MSTRFLAVIVLAFAAPVFADEPKPAVQWPKLAQGLSPVEAAKAMTAPEGFSVTLFAGEPDVVQPIAMAFDDRGRLWVAEAYSYPVRVADKDAKDRILIFEDVDGDGKFDKRTVFIEGLNLVSGMEVGFGGVWVGAAPNLLFIPDKDGDDKPDGPPQVLLDGWGAQDTHETLNAFIWGPDGWLYGCHGVFTHSNVGKPGCKPEERTKLNASVWRYHPVRHTFEVFAEGASNQWGVDFNDHGQAFITACVIPHLYHVIQGGRYQRQGGQHFNKYTYDDIKTIANHRHFVGGQWTPADREKSNAVGGGHAHAGAMIYLGGVWPEKYRNQIFMNNIHGSRINQDALSRKGSGFEGNAAPDFLYANDAWSQVINLRYGPDGNVYMIDWYDKNQCHLPNVNAHDRTNGRIFKVSYGETKPVKVDLKKLSNKELIALQTNKNDWYVRHARRVLQERAAAAPLKEDVYGEVLAVTSNVPTVETKLRAMWAAHVAGQFNEKLALSILRNGSEYEKAWAIQLSCEGGNPSDALLDQFEVLAKEDASPVVRLYLASAINRIPLESRWGIVVPLIGHEEDKDDHNLPLMDWYAVEPLIEADKNRGASLVTKTKIPLLRQFIVRRATAPAPAASRLGKDGLAPGALEGESLKVLSKTGGATGNQRMDSFTLDQWSGSDQVWWTGGKVGDKLVLAVPVEKDGKYEVTAVMTKAIDYAIVQLWLGDKKLGEPVDLFNADVVTSGVVKLGTHELKKGENKLTIEITGANEKAVKRYMFGLDYVKLTEAK
jgi:putative membrane-bound dehydrogenase-like protein